MPKKIGIQHSGFFRDPVSRNSEGTYQVLKSLWTDSCGKGDISRESCMYSSPGPGCDRFWWLQMCVFAWRGGKLLVTHENRRVSAESGARFTGGSIFLSSINWHERTGSYWGERTHTEMVFSPGHKKISAPSSFAFQTSRAQGPPASHKKQNGISHKWNFPSLSALFRSLNPSRVSQSHAVIRLQLRLTPSVCPGNLSPDFLLFLGLWGIFPDH